MTRAEAATVLRGFISDWKIDPHDAGLVYGEIPHDGIDAETLGDQLEMVGYPELASVVYAMPAETPSYSTRVADDLVDRGLVS